MFGVIAKANALQISTFHRNCFVLIPELSFALVDPVTKKVTLIL